jgi:hypothetical protein
VSQCATRNKLSEALQRQLDRRHADTLRCFAAARDTPALSALWAGSLRDGDLPGALWATLGHAHCDAALRAQVLEQLLLRQHEHVATHRRETEARAALREEIAALRASAMREQQRQAQWRSQALAEREALCREVAALRGRLLAQEAQIAALREASPAPPSPPRGALVQRVNELKQRLQALQRRANDEPAVAGPAAAPALQPAAPPAGPVPGSAPVLQSKRVLCVGGRNGHVPLYRALVERHGGCFVHHDGGIEDSVHRLDAQLAGADLVVCQAGCLNHNAYALVKAHCRRLGKPCVYLHKPGAGSFERALARGSASARPGQASPS